MFLVQHITEHYARNLFILLLFGFFCCRSQKDLGRKYVYKYLMEEMPRDFTCESVLKLADVENEVVHCMISGIRQTVFVVDPKDIDIEWSPRAETYSSRSGGSIRFFLKLKEEEHPFTWLKIRSAEKFGKKSPQIQNANITWEAGVGGCFRYYVVSPFKAIAFTLKITQDFHWYPNSEYAVDTGSAKNVRYIRTPTGTKLKLLQCRMCSDQKSVTILQSYYAKFSATSTSVKDRVECDVEYEGISTYFSTPVSIIRAKKVFYDPLFDSAYLKGVSKFPLKLETLTNPVACRVESKTLISSTNPLLNGVPGRYNVTCGNNEFSQGVVILSSRIFEIFYQEMTIPFVVKLNDPTLKMSDMERYACFWVTLTEIGKVVLNERVDSSTKNVTIHCAAFVGPIAVRATLYHLLQLSTAIKIQLLNNRQHYILGEHMDDIEVRATVGQIEIPPRDIQCSGKIAFQSPFIKISIYTKEGTVKVSCFAKYKEQKGEEKHFWIHFLGMRTILGIFRSIRLLLQPYLQNDEHQTDSQVLLSFETGYHLLDKRNYSSLLDRIPSPVSFLFLDTLKYPEIIEPPHNVIVPEIQQDLWIYMNDSKGLQTPVYRCYFTEMINLATESGRVTLRSYFTHSFSTRLYCERVMNGDPVNIPISFMIYPFNKLNVTIEPVVRRLFVAKNYEFTCISTRPELLQAYGSIMMVIYKDDSMLATSHGVSITLRANGEKEVPQIYSIRCFLLTGSHYGELSRRDVIVYDVYRFNITLVPKDEDGVYILGSTNTLRCSVSINEGLMDLDPHAPTCRLKAPSGSAQNTSDGVVRLSSDQKAGPITIDIIISLFEMDVIIKPTTVWFVDPTLFELQILKVSNTFDIRWTGKIICALKPEDMTEAFIKHFQWVGTHTNEVVPNSYYNQLLIRNQEEIQRSYTCKFKIGNLKKDLDLKYVDFSKISFSTNAATVYDIYQKGYQIHCYVHPEEAKNYVNFVWGWYDPVKKVHRRFVEVDTFEEGAHHLSCNSQRFGVRPLNITFYVLRECACYVVGANTTKLVFTPPTMARYKRSDTLPKCVWSVPWMNEEPGLKPTLIRKGFFRGNIFRGRSECKYVVPGFQISAAHVFRIIGEVKLRFTSSKGNFINRKAKLNIENPEKRTYMVGEQMPTCVWNEKWMNDLPELAPNTTTSDLLEERRTIRTITCAFRGEDIRERYSGSIVIVKMDDLRLKLSESYAAVLKETPTIVCDLDPPIQSVEKPYFYPVQEFGLAQVKGNRIIPGNSNSNSSNGTYICIFDKQDLYMTKIFVISNVDLSTSPMIYPAKREFVSGEEVECSDIKGSQSGYYAIDVFYRGTHIPLVNKNQNRAILSSAFVTEITIFCTLRNSYLNTEFGDENVTLSALVRPNKLVNLKPGDRKYVDTSAVVHCAFDSTPKIGQHVALNLFIYPLGYRHKVEKISLFSFKEQGVIGGRYFFTCSIVNDDGPLWATIDEIVFLETPAIPKISEMNVYGDQGLYCWTTEYPIWNRLLIASTESENGEIVRGEKGIYRFSSQSCYGYYNVTCEVYGYYHLIAFYSRATYQVYYTGKSSDTHRGVEVFSMSVIATVRFVTLKVLKGLQGQFLRIDLKDVTTDEALRFMTIVTLFDTAFTQVRPNFKRVAKKARKTLFTRKNFVHLGRVAVTNWMRGRLLRRRRKLSSSSSEDSLEIIEVEQSAGN
ncbi:unnamed protein product [Taenia asiatica]|uniref:Ig-like domain-containing protein n=1 Tax=Taenia asiatica TaxID=60517 RepID=A0A158R9Z6_TAEAS|nr:unnamed protein product [Taenia asiatica]